MITGVPTEGIAGVMIRCMVDIWKMKGGGVDDSIKMPRYEGLVLSYGQSFARPYISSPP